MNWGEVCKTGSTKEVFLLRLASFLLPVMDFHLHPSSPVTLDPLKQTHFFPHIDAPFLEAWISNLHRSLFAACFPLSIANSWICTEFLNFHIRQPTNREHFDIRQTLGELHWVEQSFLKMTLYRDFPGGPVVKNLPSNAGEVGSNLGRGTEILHAWGN